MRTFSGAFGAGAFFLLLTSLAGANLITTPIPVPNGSFEEPVAPEGALTGALPLEDNVAGWQYISGNGGYRLYRPTLTDDTRFKPLPPGDERQFVLLSSQDKYPVLFSTSDLGTAQAQHNYTLTVDLVLGHYKTSISGSNAKIEIWSVDAGGMERRLAQTSYTFPEQYDAFHELNVSTGPLADTSPAVGGRLVIHLIGNSGSAYLLGFDNIRLTDTVDAQFIPSPSSATFVGVGAAFLLAGCCRRRRGGPVQP